MQGIFHLNVTHLQKRIIHNSCAAQDEMWSREFIQFHLIDVKTKFTSYKLCIFLRLRQWCKVTGIIIKSSSAKCQTVKLTWISDYRHTTNSNTSMKQTQITQWDEIQINNMIIISVFLWQIVVWHSIRFFSCQICPLTHENHCLRERDNSNPN